MSHAEHVESLIGRNGEAQSAVETTPCFPPSSVPFTVTEVNHLGADTQVVSCHRYLVVFQPFVEQLTIFHTSGLVLPSSSSILRVLDLDLPHVSGMWQRGT